MNRKVYIYTLADPRTDLVRYVGKTYNVEGRYKNHCKFKEEGKVCNPHKNNWVKMLKRLGLVPKVEVIEETDEENWIECERFWIETLRFYGCKLLNATSGGDGGSGCRPSLESRLRMSASRTGVPLSEEHKESISEGLKAGGHKNLPPERKAAWQEKRRVQLVGRHHSQEHCKKISEAHLNNPNREEINKRMSEAQQNMSPEKKAEKGRKISEALTGFKHDEEFGKKLSKALTGMKRTPEQIENIKKASANVAPEVKAMIIAASVKAHLGTHHSPETRQKISAANKGKKRTEEQRRRMGAARIGKKISEEAKKLISIAHKGKKMSEETKAKLRGRQISDECRQAISKTLLSKTAEEKAAIHDKKFGNMARNRQLRLSGVLPLTKRNIMSLICKPDSYPFCLINNDGSINESKFQLAHN